MTLRDYINEREYVVVSAAGLGFPAGELFPAGHPDMDFVERVGLLDLNGEETNGNWHWDGHGGPRDDRGNSITEVAAYPAERAWKRLVAEYEAELADDQAERVGTRGEAMDYEDEDR